MHLCDLIPRRLSGALVWRIAKARRPRWFVRFVCAWFARHYALDQAAMTQPVDAYPSLLELFIRELRPEARPLDPAPTSVIAPVDAMVTACGTATDDRIVIVKGTPYTFAELLGRPAEQYRGGAFVSLYLSPADCHRIYAPCDGTVEDSRLIEGGVDPVFPAMLKRRPRILVTNRRVVTEFRTSAGRMAMVVIGALNVGRIVVEHALPCTAADGVRYAKGSAFGRFELGSSVVLVFERGGFRLRDGLAAGMPARIGEALAQMERG